MQVAVARLDLTEVSSFDVQIADPIRVQIGR